MPLGTPGTWEASLSLPWTYRSGDRRPKPRPRRLSVPSHRGAKHGTHGRYPKAKETKRRGTGNEESEYRVVPEKLGNPTPGDPVEGRRHRFTEL